MCRVLFIFNGVVRDAGLPSGYLIPAAFTRLFKCFLGKFEHISRFGRCLGTACDAKAPTDLDTAAAGSDFSAAQLAAQLGRDNLSACEVRFRKQHGKGV